MSSIIADACHLVLYYLHLIGNYLNAYMHVNISLNIHPFSSKEHYLYDASLKFHQKPKNPERTHAPTKFAIIPS